MKNGIQDKVDKEQEVHGTDRQVLRPGQRASQIGTESGEIKSLTNIHTY